MSLNIPKKALQSFSKKHLFDTFWRFSRQIEDQGFPKTDIQEFYEYLNYVSENHKDEFIKNNIQELLKTHPEDKKDQKNQNEFHKVILWLERFQKKDLKDQDFLISTVDDFQKENIETRPIHLVLDNLRSSFNVGSLFRSAESFGIEHIHLCGYTPTPENSKTAKSALGTDSWIKWSYWESTFDCLESLREKNMNLYAFETEASAKDLESFTPSYPMALILGNERYGLSETLLKEVDQTLKINMSGKKNSLNVSVCGAIAIHHFATRIIL
ncbi:MAG: RNA methyltransferase [Bacteriovoracaceae bacterium]